MVLVLLLPAAASPRNVYGGQMNIATGDYPFSIHATFVVSREHPFGAPWIRHWFLDEYLRSAKTHRLLQSARGRNRLLR